MDTTPTAPGTGPLALTVRRNLMCTPARQQRCHLLSQVVRNKTSTDP
ncbi:hypothetical protein ACFCX7_26000 [Streptomyces microflavus]